VTIQPELVAAQAVVPLVVEVDSWEYHASREAFELDRRRQNGLMVSGYRVLRFTAAMITGEPAQVIGAIRAMRRQLGRR
jgi:very-short-patch-repair endonuclease